VPTQWTVGDDFTSRRHCGQTKTVGLNLRLALSATARNALGRSEEESAQEIATMLYGEVHPHGYFRFVNFGHQLLRQGDAKVFKKYSQMKLQMKREALEKMNRQANEMPLDSGTATIQ
jgi:hypothetical protein